jgi:hypothetical protein
MTQKNVRIAGVVMPVMMTMLLLVVLAQARDRGTVFSSGTHSFGWASW